MASELIQDGILSATLDSSSAISSFKKQVARVIIPGLGLGSVLFWLSYGSLSSRQAMWGIGISVVSSLLNALWTARDWRINVWGKVFSLRSDQADFARWFVNLSVIDPAVIILMAPDPAGTLAVWVMLFVGAMCDLVDSRYRIAAMVLGICSAVATFWFLHGADLGLLRLTFLHSSLVFAGGAIFVGYSLWEKALRESHDLATDKRLRVAEMYKLRAASAIGQQSQVFAHEIKNIVGIMQLALDGKALKPERRDKILKSAAQKLAHISRFIAASSQGGTDRMKRRVVDLLEDIRLILVPLATRQQVELSVEIPQELQALWFHEIEGTTYLILHNLIKNAIEAFEPAEWNNRRPPLVECRCHLESIGDRIRIEISDNGPGLSEESLGKLLLGEFESTKEFGNGLGSKFVREQAAANGFEFYGASTQGDGSRFWIVVPVTFDRI